MRANEFLIEYSKEKTAEVLGPKIVDAFLKDEGSFPAPALDNLANKLLDQKKELGTVPPHFIQLAADMILRFIASADPTPNKQYSQWLAKCYANEGIKLEDLISKGADWLETFNKMRIHKVLPLELRDIGKLKFQQLYQIISDPELGAAFTAATQAAMPKGNSSVILNSGLVRIIWPKDTDAAMYYGQGTTWCTAARNNNYFDRYNKEGPMFILLPKKPTYTGEKYQVHFASGSFMNEQDEPVNPFELVHQKFGDLIEVFRAHDPGVNKVVEFMDDAILVPILEAIRDLAYEYVNDQELIWQDNDYQYLNWLREEGYVDEQGDIDWDKAPSYLEYDDDAKRLYNGMINAVSIDPLQVKEWANEYVLNDGESPTVDKLDRLLRWAIIYGEGISCHRANRDERDLYIGLANWIESQIVIDKNGQVSKVKARPSFRSSDI